MDLTVANILDATGGALAQGTPEAPVTGVSTDTRTVGVGDLFIALEGEKFDGHDYVQAACERGAAAVLVSRWDLDGVEGLPVVVASDTTVAYGALAAWWRCRMPARVVGITGSNGKTTTKDMLAHILSRKGATLKSHANHNNHIGVPETLLSIRSEHVFAVVEMGTNHPGEIEYLASLVRPDVGIITNVGSSHLEAFGTPRGVAREKACLLDTIVPGGLAVLSADVTWSRKLAKRHRGRVTSFGLGPGAEWRAAAVWADRELTRFVVSGWREAITVPVVGQWQVCNCLAAMAAAEEMGVSVPEAAWQLLSFSPPKMRMNLREMGGISAIIDCYNANPESMRAAVQTLIARRGGGRRVAVLGDMLELGRTAERAHKGLGTLVGTLGIDLLCAVGEWGTEISRAAMRCGMAPESVFATGDKRQAAAWLTGRLTPGDTVLFKGSRGVRLEEVAEDVAAWAASGETAHAGQRVAVGAVASD